MTTLILALLLSVVPAPASVDQPSTWYLRGDDLPVAQLSITAPTRPAPVDVDWDGTRGLTLDPGGYQEFVAEHAGLDLDGQPAITLWMASPDFADDEPAELDLGLYICRSGGCDPVARAPVVVDRVSPDGGWTERTIALPSVAATLEAGTQLCVRIDVTGDTPVMLAYDSIETPSSIELPTPDRDEPAGQDGAESGTGDDPGVSADLGTPDDRRDLIGTSWYRPRTPGSSVTPQILRSFVAGLLGSGVLTLAGAAIVLLRRSSRRSVAWGAAP